MSLEKFLTGWDVVLDLQGRLKVKRLKYEMLKILAGGA
jgi:hypothetical protein